MSSLFLGVVLFSAFGVVLLTTQGFAGSLATPSDVNPLGALEITDSTGDTLVGLDLGTSDDISSINLSFETNIPNNSVVDISLKDIDGVEIGTGSTTVSPQSKTVTITLSGGGIVTASERDMLRTVSVTVT